MHDRVSNGPGDGRDPVFDIARGLGILLVLYGHALEMFVYARSDHAVLGPAFAQWRAIYSFHMPLFFLVSGAVNTSIGRKPLAQVVAGSLSLIVLAWLTHFLGWAVQLALHPEMLHMASGKLLREMLRPAFKLTHFSTVVVWFLVALAAVRLLFAIALRHRRAVPLVLLLAAGLWILSAGRSVTILQCQTWLPGLAFFALGYWMNQRRSLPAGWLALPLAAVTLLLVPLNGGCSFAPFGDCPLSLRWPGFPLDAFAVSMANGDYGFVPLFYATALAGSLAVLSLSSLLARAAPLGKPLARLGRNSLDLFLVNGFVLAFLNPVLARVPLSALGRFDPAILVGTTVSLNFLLLLASRPLLGMLHRATDGIVTLPAHLDLVWHPLWLRWRRGHGSISPP